MILDQAAPSVNVAVSPLETLTRALDSLESVSARSLETPLAHLSYAELNGLFTALEEARHHLEKITRAVDSELTERQWNPEVRA